MARAEECACGNVSGTNPECERCELIRENKRLALLCSMYVRVLEEACDAAAMTLHHAADLKRCLEAIKQ